ncbi:MAG: SAM-dependent methyltransferase [Polyangia bacterium]|jgi:23S rRNA (cytidine2498-2'-O)-methyltransferase|nr:SAM-dependent methyltransferase [Polyangia bacterium]
MRDDLIGYLAAEGFERELELELGDVSLRHGRLLLAPKPARSAAWAQNLWLEPREMTFRSIGDAVRQLRILGRNWSMYSVVEHRRSALIREALPYVAARPIAPYSQLPRAPLGSFSLLDRNRMLVSARCSSPFPNGEARFQEDHVGPPSRAYLKLWELFTLTGRWPSPGELVLDLGSSPGGWTWALARLGARVISVDKAPLDLRVAAMPGVEHRRVSAFAISPQDMEDVSWVFSDLACYPGRLLGLVERWLAVPFASPPRMVCTIKFQGETDHGIAQRFAEIPGSRLLHLHHNRHELTWLCPG